MEERPIMQANKSHKTTEVAHRGMVSMPSDLCTGWVLCSVRLCVR